MNANRQVATLNRIVFGSLGGLVLFGGWWAITLFAAEPQADSKPKVNLPCDSNSSVNPASKVNDAAKESSGTAILAAGNAGLVKGITVTGTLKQIIGSSSTYRHPSVGDTFEIDLADLPKEKIEFTNSQPDPMSRPRPHLAYIPLQAPLIIEHVEKQTKAIGWSTVRLSSVGANVKLVIQLNADELATGSKVRIYFYEETFGKIRCMAEAEGVLAAPRAVAAVDPASEKLGLWFPAQDHVTARQLYQVQIDGLADHGDGSAKAMQRMVGQFVLVDVVVTIARDVPLVEIVVPRELASDSKPPQTIQAHLISLGAEASSRKKGERLRIEGIIVDQGFDAYTIYLHNAQSVK